MFYMNSISKKFFQNSFYILIVLGVSLLISRLFFFQTNAVIENDVDFHYARALSTIHGLINHQFPPQVDPSANSGLGYSWNIFYGPLPTYLIALLFIFTHSIALSINMTMVISVVLIGLAMYYYILSLTASPNSALISSISLITSTSILNNLYQYTGYGPLFALFFSILAFFGIHLILDKNKNNIGIVFLAIGGSGTILSHTLTCFIMVFFIFIFLIFNIKKTILNIRTFIISAFLSFGLASFFIFPFLEAKFKCNYNLFNSLFTTTYMWKSAQVLNQGRISLRDIFFSNFGVSTSPSILFWITFLLVIFTFLFITKHPLTKRMLGFLFMGLTSLMLSSDFFNWSLFPKFILTIQSPIRIMLYASGLLFSICIGLTSKIIETKLNVWNNLIIISLIICLPYISFLNIQSTTNTYKQKTINLKKLPPNTAIAFSENKGTGGKFLDTAVGEFFPSSIGTEKKSLSEIKTENKVSPFYFNSNYIGPALNQRKKQSAIFINSDEKISENNIKTSSLHTPYQVKITRENKKRTLEIPKIYYPGYKAYLTHNKHKTSLKITCSKNGYVQIALPKYSSGIVTIRYGLSLATLWGCIISLFSLMVLLQSFLTSKF